MLYLFKPLSVGFFVACAERIFNWMNTMFLNNVLMLFLFLKIFNGRIIALQCCAGFCHKTTQISHNYMYIPSLFSLPHHPTPLGHTEHQPGLLVLYINSNFLLAICFTHGNVYISMQLFQFIPPSPYPCVHSPFSMSASLFLPWI